MVELVQHGVVLRQWWWAGGPRTRATYGTGVPMLHGLHTLRLRWRRGTPWAETDRP